MIIKIGIVDSDIDYVSRLESVLSGYDDVEVYTYTDATNIEVNLKSAKLDVLLFADDMYVAAMEKQTKLAVMFLDETGAVKPELAGFETVQKYQRISSIYKMIIEQYAAIVGVSTERAGNRTKIVTCWSPVGGVGKTTISLAMATRLAKEGKSVFYINFETYPSDGTYLEDKLGRGIRELAADIRKDINFELKIKGLLQEKSTNFYYMNHFDKVIDFKDTSEDELKELVEVIANHGGFDYIIADIDSSVNTKNKRVIDIADKVILLGSQDSYATRKMAAFYDELVNKDLDSAKYLSVRNKMTPGASLTIENEINFVANLPQLNGTNEVIINSLADNMFMGQIVEAL